MKKIFDPLKLLVIGAIIVALIYLGFQLGKETDQGLVTYLKQENATLRTERDGIASELATLKAEIAAAQRPAPAGMAPVETGTTETPPEPGTFEAAAPMTQISNTFDASGEQETMEQEVMEPPTRDAIPQSGN